jgi:Calx-beta domain-containing protein
VTEDSTATTASGDYNGSSGTLTFVPGDTQETITVGVNGDTNVEPNETYVVRIYDATQPTIDTATGTIVNDDAAPGARPTTTTLTCTPLVAVNVASSCTVTVADAGGPGGSTPTGTVAITSSPAGGTHPATCPLINGACTFTFSASSANVYELKATYAGTAAHEGSEGTALVVVYDPSGGFVTGGGWIQSATGSCPGCPTGLDVGGKASFGFVSKYQKGANVPSGNTEFQYQAGDLRFKATSFEWLVVSGSKAQIKGTGTINGVGNYKFKLWAVDGGSTGDKIRIAIWDLASNEDDPYYDNKADQALAGGSIVIHK